MDKLILFTEVDRKKLVKKESGDSKFGNHIQLITQSCNIYDELKNLDVDYVLFGLPEDVGLFASSSKQGASSTWELVVKVLLNVQNNEFTQPHRLAILGHLDFTEEQTLVSSLNQNKFSDLRKARKIVEIIDSNVTHLVNTIIKAGKKPIIIGGGQNNAYGAIKGCSLAIKNPINIINLDSNINFGAEDGRHNNNAFSYAYSEGFLNKYFVFGIHEMNIQQHVLETIKKLNKNIAYTIFEDLMLRKQVKFRSECKRALSLVSNAPFGIEINCNAIEDMASNAMTPTGFSANKTREFLHYFAKHDNATYLHISEAAPSLLPKKMSKLNTKLITYLITDFIKT